MKYPHQSLYFSSEDDKKLLEALKDGAKKNNMTFSDYAKELVRVGQEKKIYDLPEAVTHIDQSGEIATLKLQLEKLKQDIIRLTKLRDTNFDFNEILKVIPTDNFITERQILFKLGKIKKSLFEDDYNEEQIELKIINLQEKLCLRADYYQDVIFKKNQGWKKCSIKK